MYIHRYSPEYFHGIVKLSGWLAESWLSHIRVCCHVHAQSMYQQQCTTSVPIYYYAVSYLHVYTLCIRIAVSYMYMYMYLCMYTRPYPTVCSLWLTAHFPAYMCRMVSALFNCPPESV